MEKTVGNLPVGRKFAAGMGKDLLIFRDIIATEMRKRGTFPNPEMRSVHFADDDVPYFAMQIYSPRCARWLLEV